MRNRDPRTKEELLDRMMSFDFDGDIRNLGAEQATIVRTAPNRIELRFKDRTYELQVRIPREEGQRPAESRSFAAEPGDDLTTVQPEEDQRPARRVPRHEQRAGH